MPSVTVYPILNVISAKVMRYEVHKSSRKEVPDHLCAFCGEWATKGSSCSDRYTVVFCNPNRNSPFGGLEVPVYCCDGCWESHGLEEATHIRSPDGLRLKVAYSVRIND